jgi:Cys-tRNA(Pro)/Cys-tRNA(Cys) deacylase
LVSILIYTHPYIFPYYNIQESLLKVNNMPTNNITRMLDAKKIPFMAFELPAEKWGAIETARYLGVPLEQVFKTIVVKREGKGKPILAVVPGSAEVDLKRLAKALAEKKLQLPSEYEAEQITGLQAGGISPLALINKGFQVVLDSSAQNYPEIHISGGQRGLNIRLSVEGLTELTKARLAEISKVD